MSFEKMPALGLGLIMSTYWLYVGFMILRNGRRTGRTKNMLIPSQRKERWLMGLWAPLVWGWISLPFAAVIHPRGRYPVLDLPDIVYSNSVLTLVRFLALGVALSCLLLSIRCWRYMGNSWRIAIDPTQENRLISDGPFAFVRHPIYALSILLMLATAVILPSPLMLALALVHILMITLKARSEESFLRARYGVLYDEYCRRTGRFMPRFSSAPALKRRAL
jgi:protein-S-isoprenylcysteine O-methyltransferase Ste14